MRFYKPLKSSIYLLIKLEKKDFYKFKSSKNYGMSRIKLRRFIKPKIKPFMTSTLIGKLFMFMTRYDFIILVLNSFQGNCSRWDGPYEILEVYDNGSILILDPKANNSFMVNGHRLKPYIGEEGPLPPHIEEMQSLEISATT